MGGLVVNTPYSRPLVVDVRAVAAWNRRNELSRRAYHAETKAKRGGFKSLGMHSVNAHGTRVPCACVRCDP